MKERSETYIESSNRPIMALDNAHPAKRFLTAFIACKNDCVGYEIGYEGADPIDQEWWSASEGKNWTFSEFAYKALSFTIELDGLLNNADFLTESETVAARQLPRYRTLMNECAEAAQREGNSEIVEMTDQVKEMLNLWDAYLDFRKGMVAKGGDR
jgi:hypothetical protein